jgi:hypothetical protein
VSFRTAATTIASSVAVAALVLINPFAASAATPGIGDVSDAMRYDVAGPFGTIVSDLSTEDDASTTFGAPFPINFFGQVSAGICLTTNGGFYPVPTDTDSCSDDYDEDLKNLALDASAPMIAVFAADQDLGECNDDTPDAWGTPCEIYFGTTTIDGRDAYVLTWYRVSMYEGENDPALDNTFQVVIIKKSTGNDTDGWDFDIEFNFGHVTDNEDGYSAADPTDECESGTTDCRWGIGWANYIGVDEADAYELFPTTPTEQLIDGGAQALTAHSLNSAVLGRYTFGMVGGVTQGFAQPFVAAAPEPQLAATGSAPSAMPWLAGAGLLLLAGAGVLVARSARATN